jgi:glycosyltransferase involved in cell wall biosynthesis
MAAGLPVIGTRVGEWAKVIEQSQTGLLIDFTPKAFAEAVVEILHNPQKCQEFSSNAIDCARQYDWRQVFASMMELVETIS